MRVRIRRFPRVRPVNDEEPKLLRADHRLLLGQLVVHAHHLVERGHEDLFGRSELSTHATQRNPEDDIPISAAPGSPQSHKSTRRRNTRDTAGAPRCRSCMARRMQAEGF